MSPKDEETEGGDEHEANDQPEGDRPDGVHPDRQAACRAAHMSDQSCCVAHTPKRAGASENAASTIPSLSRASSDG